jgi:hypothetical protein
VTGTLSSTVIPPELQQAIQLESIFMPYARKQRDAFHEKRGRFVHYTSAEAALNIIRSKRIWMRNATCMSDYREVHHGFQILNSFFADEAKNKSLYDALNACSDGVAQEAIAIFDQWWNDIQFGTYITSISEHDNKEDLHGRLSMWRAFGGNSARVALVFKVPFFSGGAGALNIMFSPVAYLTNGEAHETLQRVIENVSANLDFLRSIERPALVAIVFNMLVAGVTCLKHEGFHEEREWRAIYNPNRFRSPLMQASTELVGGVPQHVYKLPLDVMVSDLLSDLDLCKIFDRLIIGPTPYPWAMYEAFTDALAGAGLADSKKRVFTSGIPIRT